MRIDFLGIEAFLNIAERGSFHRAAAHLNLSQTALSHRIRKLEDDLGLKLFLRTTRQVSLTQAGLELLPKARMLMESLTASYESLRSQSRERQTQIAIGCLPTIATYQLPAILKTFARQNADVAVRVYDNSASEIAGLVQAGAIEFGITILSATTADLEIKPLMKERYALLSPLRHPLAAKQSVTWSEIGDAPLVRISQQAANRAIIDEALGARGEKLNWRYEVQHVGTALGLVVEGVALAVAPQFEVGVAARHGVALTPLRAPAVSRTLGVVTRRGAPLSQEGAALLRLVLKRLN
ncbi:MAG: LysR family transcriptional regulator [Hyphomicrobiales bacterium]|nr:LysR family transcriptional regulator [Hyphomicrobiales bacterium]